jgi:hypothetical protein
VTNGRFSSIDPYLGNLKVPHTLHRYEYVHSDPVNYNDPTGEFEGLAGLLTSMGIGSSNRSEEAKSKGGILARQGLRRRVMRVHLITKFAELPGIQRLVGHSRIFIEGIGTGRGVAYDVGTDPRAAFASPFRPVAGFIAPEIMTLQEAYAGKLWAFVVAEHTSQQTAAFNAWITVQKSFVDDTLMELPAHFIPADYGLVSGFIGQGINCHAWSYFAAVQAVIFRRLPI